MKTVHVLCLVFLMPSFALAVRVRRITTVDQAKVAVVNSSISFSCVASESEPASSIRWNYYPEDMSLVTIYSGQAVHDALKSRCSVFHANDSSELMMREVVAKDAGTYACLGPGKSIWISSYELIVLNYEPRCSTNVSLTELAVKEFAVIQVSCDVSYSSTWSPALSCKVGSLPAKQVLQSTDGGVLKSLVNTTMDMDGHVIECAVLFRTPTSPTQRPRDSATTVDGGGVLAYRWTSDMLRVVADSKFRASANSGIQDSKGVSDNKRMILMLLIILSLLVLLAAIFTVVFALKKRRKTDKDELVVAPADQETTVQQEHEAVQTWNQYHDTPDPPGLDNPDDFGHYLEIANSDDELHPDNEDSQPADAEQLRSIYSDLNPADVCVQVRPPVYVRLSSAGPAVATGAARKRAETQSHPGIELIHA